MAGRFAENKAIPHSVSMYPEDWDRTDQLMTKLKLTSRSDVIRYCLKYVSDIQEGDNIKKVDMDEVKKQTKLLYDMLFNEEAVKEVTGINLNHPSWEPFKQEYTRIRDVRHPKSEREFELLQLNAIKLFKGKAFVFPNMTDDEIHSYMLRYYPRDW